jgi:hypothetical protein
MMDELDSWHKVDICVKEIHLTEWECCESAIESNHTDESMKQNILKSFAFGFGAGFLFTLATFVII